MVSKPFKKDSTSYHRILYLSYTLVIDGSILTDLSRWWTEKKTNIFQHVIQFDNDRDHGAIEFDSKMRYIPLHRVRF